MSQPKGPNLAKLEEHFKHTMDLESRKLWQAPKFEDEEKNLDEAAKSLLLNKKRGDLIALNSNLAAHATHCAETMSNQEYLAVMDKIFPKEPTKTIHVINPTTSENPWLEVAIIDGKPTASQLMQQTCWLINKTCAEKARDQHPKAVADKMRILHQYIGCLARASYELQTGKDLAKEQKEKNNTALANIRSQPLQEAPDAPTFLDRFSTDQQKALIAVFRESSYELLFRDAVVTKQISSLLLDCNSLKLDAQMSEQLTNLNLVSSTEAEKSLLHSLNKQADERKETENKIAFDVAFNQAIINQIEQERRFSAKAYNSESLTEYFLRKLQAKLLRMDIPPEHSVFVNKDTLSPVSLYRGKHIWALYGEFDKTGKWVETDHPIFYYRTGSWFRSVTPHTFNRGSISDARLIFTCLEEFVRFCNPHDANDITDPRDIGGNVSVNSLMYLVHCMNMAIHPKEEDFGLPVYVKDKQSGYVYDLALPANKDLIVEFRRTGHREALTKIQPMGKLDNNGKLQALTDEALNNVNANLYETIYAGTYQQYLRSTRTAYSVNPFDRMAKKLKNQLANKPQPEAQALVQRCQGLAGANVQNTDLVHFDVCAMYLLNCNGELWSMSNKKVKAIDIGAPVLNENSPIRQEEDQIPARRNSLALQ